jgi:CubicO group peptidase (beta-lactamase class C family)
MTTPASGLGDPLEVSMSRIPSRTAAAKILAGVLLASSGAALLAGPMASSALAAVPAAAAPAAAPAGLVTRATCQAPGPAALSGFFDKLIPADLSRDKVPGAVVSVVSGGQTIFAKGYGVADKQQRTPFSPATSLVRLGSVTKLFTWTAVMQQVQAGRLNLYTDVNHYLKAFKIPATYPEPITLFDLMNHTAGFEDRIIGTGAATAADVPPLGEYLATHMPTRIRPPGQVSAYSNYGAALAGYIVSQVTGEPYASYVRQHILAPLGMTHSTATEPVPASLAAGLAQSYNSDTGDRIPFTFDPQAPDGSISATADDMANFMIAQLDGGRFGGQRILSPATAELMDRPSFAANPLLGGYAHGFEERTVNGHYILQHDGSWEGFESNLIMVPGCHLGVFVSTNGDGGTSTILDVATDFLNRFAAGSGIPDAVPAPQSTSPTTVGTPTAGFYESTRHNESTVEKLQVLTGPRHMAVDKDGTLHFQGKDWKPQGNGLYAAADGTNHLMFLVGKNGQRYVATDFSTFQPVPAEETLPFNLLVLLIFVATALSALALPATALVRRLRRRPAALSTDWRIARVLTGSAGALGLVSLLLATVELVNSGNLLDGPTLTLRLVLVAPLVTLVTAAAGAFWSVKGWRRSGAGVTARAHQVGMLAGLAALAWFLLEWNLIGWHY